MSEFREFPVSMVHAGYFVEFSFSLESFQPELNYKFVKFESIPVSFESAFSLQTEFVDCVYLNLFVSQLFGVLCLATGQVQGAAM